MKSIIGVILILFSCIVWAENELSAVEKQQRKLVSRFYEVLELLPKSCPESAREEYEKSVIKFEKAYPEFITLIRDSHFRLYAINNFSENTSPISQEACLFIKDTLDMEVSTEKGQKSGIM